MERHFKPSLRSFVKSVQIAKGRRSGFPYLEKMKTFSNPENEDSTLESENEPSTLFYSNKKAFFGSETEIVFKNNCCEILNCQL